MRRFVPSAKTGIFPHLLAVLLVIGWPLLTPPCFAEALQAGLGSGFLTGASISVRPSLACHEVGVHRRIEALPIVIEEFDRLLDGMSVANGRWAAYPSTERDGDDLLKLAQLAYRRALSALSSAECKTAAVLRLNELIRSATTTHPAVASRQFEQESARHGVAAAQWQYAPSVSAINDGYNGGVGRVEVQQPLWMGGQLSAGVDQATAQHDASRWAVLESRLSVAERVIDAYGEWLRNQQKKTSITYSLAQLNRLYLRIQRREAAGLANVSEVVLAKARLSLAASDLAQAEAAIRAAAASLGKLVGKEIAPNELMEEQAQDRREELRALQNLARAYSPALKRALAAVRVAEADVDKKRAVLSPQVNLVWQRAYGDYIVADAGSHERIMVRLQFAPGAGASALSSIGSAKAHHRATVSEVEAIERDLATRVATLFENHRATRDSMADAESTLQSAQEVQASYERQFLAGRRGWLDVMNAVREVDDAQRNLGAMQASLLVLERKLALYAGLLLDGETV